MAENVPGAVLEGGRRSARLLRGAFWLAVLWTGLSVFFASQSVLLRDVPWHVAFLLSAPRWYAWGLLTPGILWLDTRLLGAQTLARRTAWHVPLGTAWTLLAIGLQLVSRPLLGLPWPESVTVFALERFYWDLLIYAVIAGVAIARDYAAQVRAREHQAHEMALQAADLERRLVEARLQSLRAQLQPHFLFNALNTINAFTETNPPVARRLMEQLGDLLRASLTHASRPLVTLGEELTFLDDYLSIEAARFEGRIHLSVQAEDQVLPAKVPSFLLQPLVENAIRHGLANRLSGGRVDITAARHESVLQLRVRDNGTGLPPAWSLPRDAGVGLRNIVSRLEHLYGRRDLLRMVPRAEGGLEVQLDLPLQAAASAVPPYAAGVRA